MKGEQSRQRALNGGASAVRHLSGVAILIATLSSMTSPGCALLTSTPEPEFALLYNRSAQDHGPHRNPIIAIPGLLGSKLHHPTTGTTVWGAFEPAAANPNDPEGARLIALPLDETEDLRNLRDDVEPGGVLDTVRIKLLGIPLSVQAYAGILATLGAGGYRDEALGLGGEVDYGRGHFTCFQFDYDWRRDNVENARRLHEFIEEKRVYVRREYQARYGIDKPDIKFDIAAHSMGGLVTRYFLMYGSQDLPKDGSLPDLTWEGARYVERVVLIGTPNAGSPQAFLEMVNGRKLGPLLPYYPPALLGTFHAAYELLPRPRHRAVVWDGDADRPVALYDSDVWERMGWGLASPEQAAVLEVLMPHEREAGRRRERALAVQRQALRRADAFHRALDRRAVSPEGLDLFLVAGDAIDTVEQVSVDSRSGAVKILELGEGDGSVLRSSTLLDERVGQEWSPFLVTPLDLHTTLFLPYEHLELTNSPVFRDNVLFWLLESPRQSP